MHPDKRSPPHRPRQGTEAPQAEAENISRPFYGLLAELSSEIENESYRPFKVVRSAECRQDDGCRIIRTPGNAERRSSPNKIADVRSNAEPTFGVSFESSSEVESEFVRIIHVGEISAGGITSKSQRGGSYTIESSTDAGTHERKKAVGFHLSEIIQRVDAVVIDPDTEVFPRCGRGATNNSHRIGLVAVKDLLSPMSSHVHAEAGPGAEMRIELELTWDWYC